jgi:hypothetical protein
MTKVAFFNADEKEQAIVSKEFEDLLVNGGINSDFSEIPSETRGNIIILTFFGNVQKRRIV